MTPNVAALLLAAGLSKRMGTCKQLLPIEGKTVIGCCLDTLLAGGISEVIVVVGPQGGAIEKAVEGYPVTVAHTLDPQGDMAASVRTGRDALSSAVSGVVIALSDHPLVSALTVEQLARLHRQDPEAIIIPVYKGEKGHPCLFPRQILGELQEQLTLRDLVRSHPERLQLVEVNDQGVRLDMDTPEDYMLIAEIYRMKQAENEH